MNGQRATCSSRTGPSHAVNRLCRACASHVWRVVRNLHHALLCCKAVPRNLDISASWPGCVLGMLAPHTYVAP
eukprot:15478518-Alexandrium_andersonii.AAC.1